MGNILSLNEEEQQHDEQQQQQQHEIITEPQIFKQNLQGFPIEFKDNNRVGDCFFIKIPLACTKLPNLPSNFPHYAILFDIAGESDNEYIRGLFVHMILREESEGMVHLELARMDKPIDTLFYVKKMGKLLNENIIIKQQQQQGDSNNSNNNNNNNNLSFKSPIDYLNFISNESKAIFESIINNNNNNDDDNNNYQNSNNNNEETQNNSEDDVEEQSNPNNKLINLPQYWSNRTNSQKFSNQMCKHFGFDPSDIVQNDVSPAKFSQIDPLLFNNLAL